MSKTLLRPRGGRCGSVSFALAILAGATAPLFASDWINPAGGAWEAPANWSAGVPAAGGAAQFAIPGEYGVAIATSPSLDTLSLASGKVALNVAGGQNFAALNLDLSNAQANLAAGIMTVGNPSASTPTNLFRVSNGTLAVSGLGTEIRAGTSDLDLSGASNLDISQSSVVTIRRLLAGTTPDSNVMVTVHDNANNSLFKTKGSIIGQAGQATVVVTNEGRMNVDPLGSGPALTIGYSDPNTGIGGTGNLYVSGNISLLNIKGEIRIADGDKASGLMVVSRGARAGFSGTNSVPVAMTIGRDGGMGQLLVTGIDSNLKLNGALVINQNLDAHVARVETGAQINASSVQYFGDPNASKAGLIVKGLNASLDTSGDVNIATGKAIFTDTAVVTIAGTMRIGATDTSKANVRFENGRMSVGQLMIDGGDLTLTPGANKVVRAGSVVFNTPDSGVIDLADNALMVDYFDGQTSPITHIERSINPGPNSPTSMARIVSSLASADPERFALGTAEGSDLPDGGAGLRAFFREAADNTSVLVRYTVRGDANLDGAVNLDDFTTLAANFGDASSRWYRGDFNYDGQTNLDDFTTFAANFGTSLPTAGARSTVPEPTALGALAIAAAGLIRRRR